MLSNVFLLMLIPLMALATFLAQSHVRGLEGMMHLAVTYAVLAFMVRKLWRAGAQLDSLKAGYDAAVLPALIGTRSVGAWMWRRKARACH